jgi:hypothetical protein
MSVCMYIYVYMSVYICIYICLYIYIHIHILMYICWCVCVYMLVRVYIYIYIAMYICCDVYMLVRACIYILRCIYVGMCVRIYVCIYIYTHTHTYTPTTSLICRHNSTQRAVQNSYTLCVILSSHLTARHRTILNTPQNIKCQFHLQQNRKTCSCSSSTEYITCSVFQRVPSCTALAHIPHSSVFIATSNWRKSLQYLEKLEHRSGDITRLRQL